jgi:hypothetical protein
MPRECIGYSGCIMVPVASPSSIEARDLQFGIP